MYALEFLIYRLRPYGTEQTEDRPSTPEPPPDLELTATPWKFPDDNETITTTIPTTTSTESQKNVTVAT